MRPIELFAEIRHRTNGYLQPKVYRTYYEHALRAPAGSVIDIGPAQGGTTISLGLGRIDAGRLSGFYSIDAFRGSAALASKTDQELNVATLRANVEAYLPAGAVTILRAFEDRPELAIPASEPVALLSIDADGALDRDFANYFDRIVSDGIVILDDYEPKVSEKYLRYDDDALRRYLLARKADDVAAVTPLGKHYTVYRFVNHFAEKGLIVIEHVERNTVFCRKPPYAPRFRDGTGPDELARIRAEIAEEFWRIRRELAAG